MKKIVLMTAALTLLGCTRTHAMMLSNIDLNEEVRNIKRILSKIDNENFGEFYFKNQKKIFNVHSLVTEVLIKEKFKLTESEKKSLKLENLTPEKWRTWCKAVDVIFKKAKNGGKSYIAKINTIEELKDMVENYSPSGCHVEMTELEDKLTHEVYKRTKKLIMKMIMVNKSNLCQNIFTEEEEEEAKKIKKSYKPRYYYRKMENLLPTLNKAVEMKNKKLNKLAKIDA